MKSLLLCLLTCGIFVASSNAATRSDSTTVKASQKPVPKRTASREATIETLPGESPNPFTGLRYTNEDLEQMRARARVQAEIAGQNAQYEQSMLQVEENRKKREQLKRIGLTNPQAAGNTNRVLANDLIGNGSGSNPAVGVVRTPVKPTAIVTRPTPAVLPSVAPPRPSFVVGVIGTHTENLIIREGATPTQSDSAQMQRALLQLRPASTVGRVQVDNREPLALTANTNTTGQSKTTPEILAKAELSQASTPPAPGTLSSGQLTPQTTP